MSQVEEIDNQALQDLISRVEHAIEHDLALEADDLRLLLQAIHTLVALQSRLEDKDVTLHKLRKLLGMVTSSEKRFTSSKNKPPSGKNDRKPSNKTKKQTPPKIEHHALTTAQKGDPCPKCPKGKLRKTGPKVLLRITGQTPLEVTKHIAEQLKCNLCDYVVSAPLPERVTEDGGDRQQYGYSARSLMAIQKHFSGIPYYHQETLNGLFGCAVTASTIFDQCELLANDLMPCFYALKRMAANSALFYIDDTHNRILGQQPEERAKRNGQGTQMRSGIYTSGMIAVTCRGEEIYLYHTSLGHAGEFLDDILIKRASGIPPPIIMADALSRNKPTVVTEAILALCNAHGRRQFVDVESHFPDEVGPILDLYGQIWENDEVCRSKTADKEERLRYHQKHSLPIMASIKTSCEDYLTSPTCEAHSGLGKACKYFLNHYDGLTEFCKTAGAPIDNNRMEEGLKTKIRTRKNSHYYKTQTGADVANVLTSVIATAYRNGVNPFAYLNCIQKNQDEVKDNPEAWLPWNAPLV